LLVMFVTSDPRPAAGSDALSPQGVAQRLRPVGMVEVKDASDPASLSSGQQVFAGQCSACHASGALGAPKLGDAGAWAPRIKEGFQQLLQAALNGKGQMPPQKGGDFSDFEIARAVVYLTNQSGAKFPEPTPPAATADAASAQGGTAGATAAVPAPNAAAAVATANMAPRADANAGTPDKNTSAGLNAQVRQAPPEQNPGGAAGGPGVQVAAAPAAPALYAQACFVCHGAGVAGAPKLGDRAAWAPRIPQGLDALTASVIKGKGAMPPRGGSTASDADIRATVTYMVNSAK
jgi:cytochrome c5